MSDVDIELWNAKQSLLAREIDITVQTLSDETGGEYSDELIEDWLSVNA